MRDQFVRGTMQIETRLQEDLHTLYGRDICLSPLIEHAHSDWNVLLVERKKGGSIVVKTLPTAHQNSQILSSEWQRSEMLRGAISGRKTNGVELAIAKSRLHTTSTHTILETDYLRNTKPIDVRTSTSVLETLHGTELTTLPSTTWEEWKTGTRESYGGFTELFRGYEELGFLTAGQLDLLFEIYENIRGQFNEVKSNLHGDPKVEHFIYRDGKIYIIDLERSINSHPALDYAIFSSRFLSKGQENKLRTVDEAYKKRFGKMNQIQLLFRIHYLLARTLPKCLDKANPMNPEKKKLYTRMLKRIQEDFSTVLSENNVLPDLIPSIGARLRL